MVRHTGRVAKKWIRAVRNWKLKKGLFKPRRTWTKTRKFKRRGKYRGRTVKYRKRNFRKSGRKFSSLAKRINKIPMPALDTLYDELGVSFNNIQNEDLWFSAGTESTSTAKTTGMTCSADDKVLQMLVANTSAVKPSGWVLGRSKTIITSWEMTMRLINISNQPMTITLYTRRSKSDVPLIAANREFFTEMKSAFDAQYGSSGSAANLTINHPAFKFSDCTWFRNYWKILRAKSYKIMPGDMIALKKFKRKPRLLDTSKYHPALGDISAFKGDLHYIWKVHATTMEAKEGDEYTRVVPAHTFDCIYHYRLCALANDEYNLSVPGAGSSGLTLHTIYPGTSTAGDLAPAV